PNRTKRLAERILGNSNSQPLHEIDVMITKHINLPRLLDEHFYKNIPDPEKSDSPSQPQIADLEEHHKRITKIKKIRLVDIEKAKEELNE
ncbi:hypothetical protein V7183_25785, partial [Bacillus sp. JJ1127]|uniref:hypothetical protein n=1 Tax=Bacillus sp. JJ1127 TaxID=3122952 RepID=UPI002FFD8D49